MHEALSLHDAKKPYGQGQRTSPYGLQLGLVQPAGPTKQRYIDSYDHPVDVRWSLHTLGWSRKASRHQACLLPEGCATVHEGFIALSCISLQVSSLWYDL